MVTRIQDPASVASGLDALFPDFASRRHVRLPIALLERRDE
jgi:hypothetical protein